MKRVAIPLIVAWLLIGGSNFSRAYDRAGTVESGKLGGKVFRSDTNDAITNSYILLMQEIEPPARAEHFDLRTDENGNYHFTNIPAGKYTVSVYAWFRNRADVPCNDPVDSTIDETRRVSVEWQRKSDAFMEILKIKGFSVAAGRETLTDFDLSCPERHP